MNTPVALIIFNRPDVTARVFEHVALARPKRLFIIADGPRPDRPGEAERCAATRAVVENVSWDCDVMRNYADVNLGVGERPASGLQWVFEHVEDAIILEDDCVADETFFRYCEELLSHYRADERVMHISGDNWNFGRPRDTSSYLFSWYTYSCGWATWRRAFRHYDPEIRLWPQLRATSWLRDLLADAEAADFWASKFDLLHQVGIRNTGWDWPWLFACWAQHGLSILPATNLITNIGFDPDATHTTNVDDARAFVPTVPMQFPLHHPPGMVPDRDVDRRIAEQVGVTRAPQGPYHAVRRAVVSALPQAVRRSLAAIRSTLSTHTRGA